MAGRPARSSGGGLDLPTSWQDRYDGLATADRVEAVEAGNLEEFATAAYMTGRNREAIACWARAHTRHVAEGDVGRAARLAGLLSLLALLRGEASVSGGWLARAERLVRAMPEPKGAGGICCVVRGLRALGAGYPGAGLAAFDEGVSEAAATDDADVLAAGLLGRGQVLLALGKPGPSASCFDEAMAMVTSGAVSPVFGGIVYCGVILACQSTFDIVRAREWTGAFDAWCDAQADIVPYRGQCLIHRSEILQMQGHWPEAMAMAERACAHFDGSEEATSARALYQLGEVQRLTGAFEVAERNYDQAASLGYEPQPGRALMTLAGGHAVAAAAAIRDACEGARNATLSRRLGLLAAAVEIYLGANDLAAATAAADELAAGAATLGRPLLDATAGLATGGVLAASGNLDEARSALNGALGAWQRLEIPYEAARTRARLARICAALGDRSTAQRHGEAARSMFHALGARPDLAALQGAAWPKASGAGLTERQMEVLRQLAKGRTNRQIAHRLGISEHTVARHVSNIFDKAGVSSRLEAVTYAHRVGMITWAHGQF